MKDTRRSYSKKIIQRLGTLHDNINSIKSDTQLLSGEIIDSLDMMELLLFLEDELGMDIDSDRLVPENYKTPQDIAVFFSNIQNDQ